VCVSACFVAAFIVGNDSPQTPQPYEPLLFARATFFFAAFFPLPFAAFLGGAFFVVGFVGFSTFAFGSCDAVLRTVRFGVSVPSTLQKRHPLHATPFIAAFPADDGLVNSRPSSSRYRRPSAVCTTSHVRPLPLYRACNTVPVFRFLFSSGMTSLLVRALPLGDVIHHSPLIRSQPLTLPRRMALAMTVRVGLDLCGNQSGHVTMRHQQASPQPIGDLVELYLLRCRVEGKAECTVRAYGWTLGRFLRNLADDGIPLAASSVTQVHVYRYLGSFAHLSLDTRHRYFREVRCFFNWLVEAGYLESSPFAHVRNVRLPNKIVQPFTLDDVRQLLAACPDAPAGIRDRAILVTLLDTGLRISELAQLNLDDVNFELMRLRVLHAKGNKQRVASFSDTCKRDLVRYVSLRGSEPGPLFCATTGHGRTRPNAYLHSNGIKQMLRRLGRKTGLPKVHAHRFRHTFATWAIDQGARELDVQLLLGHSSPDMVRRYTSSYNAEQAAKRHVEFSPATMLDAVSAQSPNAS